VCSSDLLNHSSDITFGASLYDPDDWNSLRNYDEISVYQVPYSIFDRRFLDSRVIDEMVEKGKKVQVRSIFLQGLLLMGQKDTPKYFEPWLPQLNEFHDFCEETGFSASGIAAAFVLQNDIFDGVVVGFQSKGELLELASHFSAGLVTLDHFPTFNDLGLEILDPRNWRLS
jgi:aryl-alcohol dehydrogenase-like predicted oxidoreductase